MCGLQKDRGGSEAATAPRVESATGGRVTYRRRVDRNHNDVLDRLRALGWHVCDLHAVPGFFDAVAIRAGCVRFVEVKDGTKAPSQRRLTEAQKPLHEDFTRHGAVVVVLTSTADAESMR